jgi:threonine dehydrogenase-like Zn-dependent dehydrogenase
MLARAFWTTGVGIGEIREEEVGPPGAREVLVETMWSAVSRGTESLVFHGRVPASEHERMRAPHQAGSFPFPVKYGYASVGRAGEKIVFCLYPHQTHYVVAESALVAVPANVDPARAVLAANLETAINGVWDAEVRVGDRVAVVGAGVVGALVAYVACRIAGCRVELVDIRPERERTAKAMGAAFALPGAATREADVVLHTSGTPEGLATALALAGHESTIADLSWYGDRTAELHLGGAFHSRRLQIRSSQVGGIPAAQRARWTSRRRLELALSMLSDPALDALFDGESTLGDLPAVMPRLDGLCHRVRYHP